MPVTTSNLNMRPIILKATLVPLGLHLSTVSASQLDHSTMAGHTTVDLPGWVDMWT